MHAIVFHRPGGPEVLEYVEVPDPRPAAGEVLIRVHAAGVNRADVLQREGRYPMPTGANPVPGLEVAGEIAALGEGVTGWNVGDRFTTLTNGGGYAEYVCAPAVQLLRWPHGYDAVLAAALPEACFTVWANLFQAAALKAGETCFIHGGRGGVGAMAIQLAAAFGAQVLASSGTTEGCHDCAKLGASIVVNYHTEDFVAACHRATNGRGVDVILDPIGAANLQRNLAALATDGRLSIIGFTGGAVADKVDLTPILARRLVITGSAMRPRSALEKGAIAVALADRVWPLLDRGACRPPLAKVFPLERAADAHRLMQTGGYLGKIVLAAAH
ncbi:MAG TPA: NAD(P)H-quinone oxidoreductase [Rhodanobacteraceae bacterium]|nr:NAD(P)H-quinone oxidoreductase [Rhodanobacteraceae bacterium]